MDNILDDLSLEDVQKANEDNTSYRTSDDKQGSVHVSRVFNEFRRGKKILRFAYVAFGEYERYDIRLWYDQGQKPGKGFSVTQGELDKLKKDFRGFDFRKTRFEERAQYRGEKVSATLYDRISLLSEFSIKGVRWYKEVAVVDFGYGKKIDFRKWSNDYTVCGKGISVTFDEIMAIKESINCL